MSGRYKTIQVKPEVHARVKDLMHAKKLDSLGEAVAFAIGQKGAA